MTQSSIREYTEAMRGRYLRVSKKKGRTLDEFTGVVGCLKGITFLAQAELDYPRANVADS